MNNRFNIEKNKEKKVKWRMLLGVIISLLLFFCVDMILWGVGIIGTTLKWGSVVLLNLIFVLSIEVILWAIGCWKIEKK